MTRPPPEVSGAPVGSFWAEATAQQAAVFWQAEAAWAEILDERESFGWSALHDERLTETQAFAAHEELLFNGLPAGGFSVLQWEGVGTMRNIGNLAADLGRILTLEIVQTAGQPYLLGVSRDKDMLVAWRVLEDGDLVETSRVDFGAVLGIRSPKEMTVRVLGDVPYMLLVGENDHAPGVLAMTETGELHLAETLLELGVLPCGALRVPRVALTKAAVPVAFGIELMLAPVVPPVWLVPGGGIALQLAGDLVPGYAVLSA
ncbi:hypothetical protein [Salipiger aestuarii]|uniref:hypothetical protein n=1 Tax=Salipiger aestuarii TaxID=568098 RepID=UPI0012387B5D|nr:hypothetical protein [Salipiger aestuarii]KAA8607598.1 hypothetical protein AL037_18585 [Salipiger aestuarii]